MYWRPPLRRPRLVCALIACVFVLFYRRHIHAAFLLAAEPLIFTYGDKSFIVSQTRDDFDVTFSAYSSSPITNISSLNSNAYLVPPIIHSIFLGPDAMRPKWLAAHEACRQQHPSYEFMLWKDSSAKRFVQHHYPETYKTWISYPQLIQRADSLRYMLLHHYGGIYMDLDLHCRRPLDPLRQFPFVAPAAFPAGISNGFIMSVPNSTFMHDVIAALPRFDLNWFGLPYLRVSFSTGCHFLSTIHAWSSALERKDLRVLAGGAGGERLHQLNGNVSTPLFHHWGSSSWHSYDAEIVKMVKTGSWRGKMDKRVGRIGGAVIAFATGCAVSVVCFTSFLALVAVVRVAKSRCHGVDEKERPRGRRMWSETHWKGELKV